MTLGEFLETRNEASELDLIRKAQVLNLHGTVVEIECDPGTWTTSQLVELERAAQYVAESARIEWQRRAKSRT